MNIEFLSRTSISHGSWMKGKMQWEKRKMTKFLRNERSEIGFDAVLATHLLRALSYNTTHTNNGKVVLVYIEVSNMMVS